MTHHWLEAMLRSQEYGLVLEVARSLVGTTPVDSADGQWVAAVACRAAAELGAWGDAADWANRGLAFQGGSPEAERWLHEILTTAPSECITS